MMILGSNEEGNNMTQLLVFQRQCLYISSQKRQYMGKYAGLVAAFHINDILFGLSTHINEAIHIVQHHHHLNKKKQFFYIQAELTDCVWNPIHRNKYSSGREITASVWCRNEDEIKFAINFKNYLMSHQKYNVIDTHNKYYGDKRNLWGHTSKAGLEYILTQSERTIHFIITGINLSDVATKTGHGAKPNVTSKELRWLFRNRHLWENVGNPPHSRVRFWNESRECPDFMMSHEWHL